MQRLYFTFPNAWPGAGLLLLRLGQLGLFFSVNHAGPADAVRLSMLVIGTLTSGLLAVGLWTPLAGVALAMTQGVNAYFDPPQAHLSVALLGLSLAMLGPGSWSIDARLFGRRRIKIEDYDQS
jgi:uncharacterized membrane protein YphA (DoxX/SURF4 family)